MSALEDMAAPEETVATGTIAVSESRPIREYLSRTEVAEAIRSLKDAEKAKLMKFARLQAAKTLQDGEDLFHEALARCLETGRRNWPRDVPALGFLCGVMRSIASEWKNDVLRDTSAEPDTGDGERDAIATIDAQRLIKLFDDDLIAQAMVIGMIQGERGEELRQSSGLNEIEYESKRRKIRRRVEKFSRT